MSGGVAKIAEAEINWERYFMTRWQLIRVQEILATINRLQDNKAVRAKNWVLNCAKCPHDPVWQAIEKSMGKAAEAADAILDEVVKQQIAILEAELRTIGVEP